MGLEDRKTLGFISSYCLLFPFHKRKSMFAALHLDLWAEGQASDKHSSSLQKESVSPVKITGTPGSQVILSVFLFFFFLQYRVNCVDVGVDLVSRNIRRIHGLARSCRRPSGGSPCSENDRRSCPPSPATSNQPFM